MNLGGSRDSSEPLYQITRLAFVDGKPYRYAIEHVDSGQVVGAHNSVVSAARTGSGWKQIESQNRGLERIGRWGASRC